MKNKTLLGSIAVTVAVVVIGVLLVYPRPGHNHPPEEGDMVRFVTELELKAPSPAEFLDPQDQPTSLAAFQGKVVLLNLWATWCTPCLEELPSLAKLNSLRASPHFAVVTVSEDNRGRPAVTKFAATHPMGDLPANLDPDLKLSEALGISGLPTTVLLDPKGRILGRYEGGADWSSPNALNLIDWYLARAFPQSGDSSSGSSSVSTR